MCPQRFETFHVRKNAALRQFCFFPIKRAPARFSIESRKVKRTPSHPHSPYGRRASERASVRACLPACLPVRRCLSIYRSAWPALDRLIIQPRLDREVVRIRRLIIEGRVRLRALHSSRSERF